MRRPALRNAEGTPVDPVPVLVVVALAFMVSVSIGPIYGQAYGLSLAASLAVSGGAFLLTAVGAYRWLVRDAHPEVAGEVDPADRFATLVYLALALLALFVGLTVPLL
ncbi:hypothetical protein [Haloparvum sedimenti]|uniref:hypothetical protein n=1 Tax=Haloparvum sedimenti TaxID=1678448 RepID=UPI00071E75B3|nr:hypothetical protein [Haloparvum sedimenti]